MNINNAYQIINGKLVAWLHDLIRLLPNIVFAAVILTLGIFVAKVVKKIVTSILKKTSSNQSLNNLGISLVYIFCLGLTVFTALSILQLDKAVTSILAGAGIIGLALAFAFQDIAANFISGIFISFRQPIRIGNIVKIKDFMGKVEEINMRDTVIRTFQGEMVILPNKDVFQNPIENYSLLGKRRFDLAIGISYGEDLELVKEVTLKAVTGIERLSDTDEITFFYKGFGDSSINFAVRMWVASAEQIDYITVGSEAIMRIKKASDERGILIPYPIRTIDFGIKGGISLKEQLDEILTQKNNAD